MNEHKELELKYLTNKDFKLARLLNLLTKNGFIILDMHDVINIDKYFDTPNKDLLKDLKENVKKFARKNSTKDICNILFNN